MCHAVFVRQAMSDWGRRKKKKKINVIRSLACSVTVGDGLRYRRGNGMKTVWEKAHFVLQ